MNQIPTLIKAAFLLALPLSLSGCFLLGGGESRGVKLSDAMVSSAQGDKQDLGGSSSREDYSIVDVVTAVSATAAADSEGFFGLSYQKAEHSWQLPVEVMYAIPFNGDFQSLIHFTITPLSHEDEHQFFGLYLGGAIVEFKSGSLPDRGTEGPWIFEAGFVYRRYFNSSRTALSPYVMGSVGYQMLNWNYRHDVVAGGDTTGWDSLNGMEGYVGFGVSTRRDSRISFFGEVGVGGTAFDETTMQGFDNDVFDEFSFVSFKVGLSLKF